MPEPRLTIDMPSILISSFYQVVINRTIETPCVPLTSGIPKQGIRRRDVDRSTRAGVTRPRKSRAIVVAGLALSVLAAACSGSATPTAAPASGAAPSSGGGGEVALRFLFPEYSAKTVDLMTEVVNDFNTANAGKIKVSLETSPWDKMHDKLAVSMGSGQAPCMFGYATRWISEFAGPESARPARRPAPGRRSRTASSRSCSMRASSMARPTGSPSRRPPACCSTTRTCSPRPVSSRRRTGMNS